ncbi:MAG: response regulator [Defluviicoccus sp.]|nr:MAG: response regulator [Defluviicoccus sp.]
MIAMELHRLVTNAGLEVSGPAGTLDQALHLASDQTLTGAILDINLGGETSYPIADRLRNRSVPFIFVSGYIAESAPERFASCTILQKPVEPRALMSVLRQQLSNSPEIQNRAEPPSHCTQRR